MIGSCAKSSARRCRSWAVSRSRAFRSRWRARVELGAPAYVLAAAPRALGMLGPGVAPTLAPDRVQRGISAADGMKAITHDPRVRERRPDRVPVGVSPIDRDDLDRCPHTVRPIGQ